MKSVVKPVVKVIDEGKSSPHFYSTYHYILNVDRVVGTVRVPFYTKGG